MNGPQRVAVVLVQFGETSDEDDVKGFELTITDTQKWCVGCVGWKKVFDSYHRATNQFSSKSTISYMQISEITLRLALQCTVFGRQSIWVTNDLTNERPTKQKQTNPLFIHLLFTYPFMYSATTQWMAAVCIARPYDQRRAEQVKNYFEPPHLNTFYLRCGWMYLSIVGRKTIYCSLDMDAGERLV